MQLVVRIVPLIRYGERGWERTRYRWQLEVEGEVHGRYATMREARETAEEYLGKMTWAHDAETGAFTGAPSLRRRLLTSARDV